MNKLWKKTCLDGEWKLYLAENSKVKNFVFTSSVQLTGDIFTCIDGKVPGNFELDMERAGMLPDLFFGTNALLAQKLENMHLWYVRTFVWNGKNAEQMYFDFEGIDTIAEVYLNGVKIAETDNMFIAHEFKASGLKLGENELMVHIKPAVLEARKRKAEPYAKAMYYNWESITVRKAAHMYGWDIFPRIVSGGIWRSVYLYERPEDYIDELYMYSVKLERNLVRIETYYSIHAQTSDFNRDYSLRVTATCGDSLFTFTKPLWSVEGTEKRNMFDPKFWWPRDMGDANLYDVKAELLLKGEIVDTYETRFGIRDIKLEYTDLTDEEGNGEFLFKVNDEPLFIRGTNWVPLDAFHSRDKERLPMALNALWESGCNGVRCWGGNVYEDHDFFDFCDEHGIIVWQDFAMGCATYPQTEQMRKSLETEAFAVIRKLRQHPSLALWVGDNECDVSATEWGLMRNPDENIITRKILPEVIRRQDPIRQFLPSSPFISQKAIGKTLQTSEQHVWGPRDYFKSDFYTSNIAHFASETGYHGCTCPESIKKYISKEKLFPWKDNDEWIVHASQMTLPTALGGENTELEQFPYLFRIELMSKQIGVLFGIQPDNLHDFALASQISEAEADKFFVERFRSAKWRRTGIMWWNLIDGWPQFSDAVVDYYGVRKLAFYILRNVQEPICLMFREPVDGKYTFVGANETLKEQMVSYKVRELCSDRTVLMGEVKIPPNAVAEIAELPQKSNQVEFYAIEWSVNGKVCRNHYVAGKPPYDFKQYVEWLKQAEVFELEGF